MRPDGPASRIAACACGRLTAVCAGEPEKISLCHCRQCQKRTGSAFGIAVFYSGDRVTTNGPARAHERGSDSGHPVTFHFCVTCGSTVYWRPARTPGRMAIAYGAFADPALPAPTQSVFDAEGHPWARALAIAPPPHHLAKSEEQSRP